MSSALLSRTLALQLILTGLAAAVALALWGLDAAVAVLVAGAVSFLDLLVIGLAAARLAAGRQRGRLACTILLALKFPVLVGLVYLLVAVLELDTLGLILGFGTLVASILYASLSRSAGTGETP